MTPSDDHDFRNGLLKAIPPAELPRLSAHWELVALPKRKQIELPNRKIEDVYFPESGLVSIVSSANRITVEVGIIGPEGMTGSAAINLADRSPYHTFMQIEGTGYRLPVAALERAMEESAAIGKIFRNYAFVFQIQTSETAMTNARANIEARLARWLVMALDRLGGPDLPLTHDFLAVMMGTRRPGVTEAVHELANKGMIRGGRGSICVLDRNGLETQAGPYYGLTEREYRRLIGPLPQA